MIQKETILQVADNSGAKTATCIKILNGGSKKVAGIGDCILVSIRSLRTGKGFSQESETNKSSKGAIKKGQIYKALIIRTKKGISNRIYGHSVSFDTNDIILLTGTNAAGNLQNLMGTRLMGPITRELRMKNYNKVISQAKGLL